MFFSLDNDELSQYLGMLYEETSFGTSDYDRHDLNPLYWDILLKPISSEPEKWEDKSALDFGTSRGRNLKNLDGLANWKELHGVDLSKKNIDENIKNFQDSKYHFHKTSGRNLKKFNDESFDFVISTLVFQHIPIHKFRLELLKEIYRVMKTDGVFTFQMGFGENLKERAFPNHWFVRMKSQVVIFPSQLPVAGYYDNVYNASGSHGEYDVRVTDPNNLFDDLFKIGFKKVDYSIQNSYDEYIHKYWIYLTCYK
jgi:ubiquinone/menaquinone biosynthesis C-methylase UbiE